MRNQMNYKILMKEEVRVAIFVRLDYNHFSTDKTYGGVNHGCENY